MAEKIAFQDAALNERFEIVSDQDISIRIPKLRFDGKLSEANEDVAKYIAQSATLTHIREKSGAKAAPAPAKATEKAQEK